MVLGGLAVFGLSTAQDKPETLETATVAGGCFWCIEAPFDKTKGVHRAVSGYSGGKKANPSYKDVSSGRTKHREAVQIHFDPKVITYEEVLNKFWMQFDPTDDGGSFYDRGHHYTSAIYYHNEEQRKIAEATKKALASSGRFSKPIVTPIEEFANFYPAEDYHQDYYKKNPAHYNRYRTGSGRDTFIEKHWGNEPMSSGKYFKPSDKELRKKLSSLQYKVTQEDGTERPFNNDFWDNKREGIYVDIVSGEPLFSSTHKYKSGTGWPSFYQPLVSENIVEKSDHKLFMKRTEVRSKYGDSHLGHVFSDGPKPTGLRYCMNSASMRFIPKEDLGKEGYEEFASLFQN